MKQLLCVAALSALPLGVMAQFIPPSNPPEDNFQPTLAWDIGTRGLGNVNAADYFLNGNNVDLYLSTWDSGEPVYDNKYGGFVLRQYPHGTAVNSSTSYSYEQYKSAFGTVGGDFDGNHISSLEAGFFQYNGNTYVALTYFAIASSSETSGKFYIRAYQWDPALGTLTDIGLPQPLPFTTSSVPLNATDGWIHQDINDQGQIVMTWDEGGRIYTQSAELTNPSSYTPFTLSGAGILDVPVAGLSKPDVAVTELTTGGSDIYYTFIANSSDDAGQELWVYKGDYASLSGIPSGTTQLLAVDSVYHRSTDGTFGLPRIDAPNVSDPDNEYWSAVVADYQNQNNYIFAASYNDGTGLHEQILNDGSLNPSLQDLSLNGIYKNDRPTVAFSPIDNDLYFAWTFKQQNQYPTYISVKTTANLSLLNSPAAYFLMTANNSLDRFYPGVGLATTNDNGVDQLFTSFMQDPSQTSLYLVLGLKTANWGSNNGYRPAPSGIAEAIQQNAFSVSPNPFRSGFRIDATAASQDLNITIFNILGQKIYQDKGTQDKINKGLQSIGQNLNAGTYFVELKGKDSGAFRKEVVKW